MTAEEIANKFFDPSEPDNGPTYQKILSALRMYEEQVLPVIAEYGDEKNYKAGTYWAYPDGSAPSMFSHDPEGLVEFRSESKIQMDCGKRARALLAKLRGEE